MSRFIFVLFGALVLSACGGGAGGSDCQGVRLSDEQVCQLTCGVTTQLGAQSLLGQPTQSVTGLIEYSYVCAGSESIDSYNFFFDSGSGKLYSVSRTGSGTYAGLMVPACLSSCHP
jgi:hypothetical protein